MEANTEIPIVTSSLLSREAMQMACYQFQLYHMTMVEPTGNRLLGKKLPKPRSGHRCVASDANLFCFGGYNPHISSTDDDMRDDPNWSESCPLFRELWCFNISAGCWVQLQTTGFVPKELASHSAVLWFRYLLVYGGTGVPFGTSSSNKLYVCDLKTLKWQEVTTNGVKPLPRYGQAVTLDGNSSGGGGGGGQLYVVGGTTGFEYSIDVHRLDLATGEWEEMVARRGHPTERYRHEIVYYEGRLYVFGGGTAIESFWLHEIPAFDLKACRWKKARTQPDRRLLQLQNGAHGGYPAPRRCHSLVYRPGGADVVVAGGYNGDTIFPDVWLLNLKTRIWRCLALTTPRPTYFHSAALTPAGCMYVYGGVTNIRDNHRTSDICKMWVALPKLKEMCWEALLYYCPTLAFDHSRVALLEAGIPVEFVDRIEIQAEYG